MDDLLAKLLGIKEGFTAEGGKRSLDWTNLPAPWVFALILLVTVGVAIFIYSRERKDVSAIPKMILAVFRTLAICVLLLMLFEAPVLTLDITKDRKHTIVVLIDESESMAKNDPGLTDSQLSELARVTGMTKEEVARATRMALVQRTLGNPELKVLDTLESRMKVAYFAFWKNIRSIKKDDIATLETREHRATAIGEAIKNAMTALRGEKIAAVVVVSDGRNNDGVDPLEVCKDLGNPEFAPVYTIQPGFAGQDVDTALVGLEAPEATLINEPMRVGFGAKAKGYGSDKKVTVDFFINPLRDENEVLPRSPEEIETRIARAHLEQSMSVPVPNSDHVVQREFVYTPKEKGYFELILRIVPDEQEFNRQNNYLTQKLRVADDKVRVLYVEYPPRYEYKYLQNMLKRDDSILFHAWLTSADQDFPQEHSQRIKDDVSAADKDYFSKPLKEFPRDLKALNDHYDVLMIGDVDPGTIGGEETWKHIHDFVFLHGGGVVFMSGVRSNPESFKNTALEDLLPIEPLERGSEMEPFDKQLRYVITKDGEKHPAIRFPGKDLKVWDAEDGVPRLYWYKPVKSVKRTAQELMSLAPDGDSGGTKYPLMVSKLYGRGRVFMSLTDETWRWRWLTGDQPYFSPFWKQVIKWSRYGRLQGSKRFRIEVEKDKYNHGEKVKLFIWAYDANLQGLKDPIDVHIIPPVGSEQKTEQAKVLDADNKPGYYEYQFGPDATGAYKVWVGDPGDDKERSYVQFTVEVPNPENEDPKIDATLLFQMAQVSHKGQALNLTTIDELLKILQPHTDHVTDTKEWTIWDSPLFYLIFALLITIEWVARKALRML